MDHSAPSGRRRSIAQIDWNTSSLCAIARSLKPGEACGLAMALPSFQAEPTGEAMEQSAFVVGTWISFSPIGPAVPEG